MNEKDKAIAQAMASIQNRLRHVYNQGFEDGRKAERKMGKWEVRLMRHFAHLIICSNCGADINITAEEYVEYYKRNFRYCPYCGAKMEVDE